MTLSDDEIHLIQTGFIFELAIIALWFVLLLLIFVHYREKKTRLNKLIFTAFSLLWLSIVFSAIAKLFYMITKESLTYFEGNPWFWLIARITQYRISFTVIIIACYILYLFKEEIFRKEPHDTLNKIYLISSITCSLFCLITIFQEENVILDLLCFGLTAIFTMMCLIPFMMESFQLYRRLDESERIFKHALLSFIAMTIFLLLILVFMVLDRVMIFANPDSFGFSVFYYLGWISAILGVISTYLGYIRPSVEQKQKAAPLE